MSREVISSQKLLEWINSKLHDHEDCKDCEYLGVTRSRVLHDNGCNWSADKHLMGHCSESCKTILDEIVLEAGRRFNIE